MLESYLSDLDWRRDIYLSHKMGKSPTELNEILEKLALKLIDRRRFSEAAVLYEKYLEVGLILDCFLSKSCRFLNKFIVSVDTIFSGHFNKNFVKLIE